MRPRLILAALLAAVLTGPAPASGIFGRKSNKSDTEQATILIATLKSSPDDRKRAAAAAELGKLDARVSPEIVPVLLEALGRDMSAAVRAEAAESLGKVRPINMQVGFGLEQALANDGSMKVRLAARTSLWQYRLHGFRGNATRPDTMVGSQTREPPIAGPTGPPMVVPPTQPAPAPAPPSSRWRLFSRLRGTDNSSASRPTVPTPLPVPSGPQPTTQEPPLLAPPPAAPTAPPPAPGGGSGPRLSPPG